MQEKMQFLVIWDYKQGKVHAQMRWAWKKFITLEQVMYCVCLSLCNTLC